MNELVSIITPTFNSKEQITETYNSILSQDYTNWEWLVTDDCSTDSTVELLLDISARDKRVKVFVNEINGGAAVSRNKSIGNSSGSYLAFLDSDDLWEENKISSQLEFMKKDAIDFSFTPYEIVDKDGASSGKFVDTHLSCPVNYNDMLRKKATLGCSTVMLRRAAFKDLTMPLLRTGQDYALWLKLLKGGVEAHIMPTVLSKYRILPGSISRNKLKKARRQWEIYRVVEGLDYFTAIECFSYYAVRAIFRK